MKCPECGDDVADGSTRCENCGQFIYRYMSDHRECFTCHSRVHRDIEKCPECGTEFPRVDIGDEVLSSYEMGPAEAPLMKREFKVYDDRVVVESRSSITGARVVATVRRPLWRWANIAYATFFLVMAAVSISMGFMFSSVLLHLLGLLPASIGAYMLAVTVWLDRKASSRAATSGKDP